MLGLTCKWVLKKGIHVKKQFSYISPIWPQDPIDRYAPNLVANVIIRAKFFNDRMNDVDSVGVKNW